MLVARAIQPVPPLGGANEPFGLDVRNDLIDAIRCYRGSLRKPEQGFSLTLGAVAGYGQRRKSLKLDVKVFKLGGLVCRLHLELAERNSSAR